MQTAGRFKEFEGICRRMRKKISSEDEAKLISLADDVSREGDNPFLVIILNKLAKIYAERNMDVRACSYYFESGRVNMLMELDLKRYETPTTMEYISSAYESFSIVVDTLIEKEIFTIASAISLEFADCLKVIERYYESAEFYGKAAILFRSVHCDVLSYLSLERKFVCELLSDSMNEALDTIQKMNALLTSSASKSLTFSKDNLPLCQSVEVLVLVRMGRIEDALEKISSLMIDPSTEDLGLILSITTTNIVSGDAKALKITAFHFQRYTVQSEAMATIACLMMGGE